MANVAVKGFTVEANGGSIQGNFIVETQASEYVLIENKGCYFGDVEVTVPAGSTSPAGTLTSNVKIKIEATGKNMLYDGDKTLVENDKSSGLDTGTFQQGTVTTSVPITLVVTDAGQNIVDLA